MHPVVYFVSYLHYLGFCLLKKMLESPKKVIIVRNYLDVLIVRKTICVRFFNHALSTNIS